MVTADELELQGGRIELVLDLRVYRLTAIQKAGYKLADRMTLAIGTPSATELRVSLVFGSTVSATEARETGRMFFEELLDQELREKIGDETRSVRELILAHAFSRTGLVPQG